jgi:hypothetical protein
MSAPAVTPKGKGIPSLGSIPLPKDATVYVQPDELTDLRQQLLAVENALNCAVTDSSDRRLVLEPRPLEESGGVVGAPIHVSFYMTRDARVAVTFDVPVCGDDAAARFVGIRVMRRILAVIKDGMTVEEAIAKWKIDLKPIVVPPELAQVITECAHRAAGGGSV